MQRTDQLSSLIRPYRNRLGLFSALKALIYGLTAGFTGYALTEFIMKITRSEWGKLPLIIGGCVFAAVFVTACVILRPSNRHTVQKIDALGLQERTATMFAMSGSGADIAVLQRRDAMNHLRAVNKDQLKEKIAPISLLLCLCALLIAIGSALLPRAWFAPSEEEQQAEELMQSVLDMLREEQQKLEAQGEDALSDEMNNLIDDLMESDNLLDAIGRINSAESAADRAAENGEASDEAAGEMNDVLERAKELLLQRGEQQNGQEMEGMIPVPAEGEEGEGEGEPVPGEGEGEEGDMPGQGEGEDGEMPNGENPGRGQGFEGDGVDGVSNMTERIYDPISGDVQYGEVYSAYLSDYMKEADGGEIPFNLQRAADEYFSRLDK